MRSMLLCAWIMAVAAEGMIQAPDNLSADGSNTLAEAPAASFALASAPAFSWAPRHGTNGEVQTSYELSVTQSHQQHGQSPDVTVWTSGKVASELPRCVYTGPALVARTYYTWKVRFYDSRNVASPWSHPAEFHMAPSSVSSPSWISSIKTADGKEPINLFRASVTVKSSITRATLYICGLGYSYASVNGQPAGPQLLTTAPWSNNERRNGFSSLDVTALLKTGANAVGVALGHGWRDQSKFVRHDPDNAQNDKVDKTFWAQLHVVYADGSSGVLADTATPGLWLGGVGPVQADSVYDGESYDANMEQPGWDTTTFAPSAGWKTMAPSTDAPAGRLTPWTAPPVLLDSIVKPVGISQPYPGVFVVDFGMNQAGVCKLSNLKLKKGANITLVHAEIMQHDLLPDVPKPDPKLVYVGNLRTAKATDKYTAKGDPAGESFLPRFTYHGFRFVQVTGLTSLTSDDIEMHHFHSANEPKTVATFKSKVLNQIMAMGVGSQRSNSMTLQTDCDQRDERLGWMGDINLSGDSLALNFKAGPFLASYLETMNDELNADGSSVDVAPLVRYGSRPGDISWTAAYIALPYALYKVNGDLSAARTYLDGMLAHIENVNTQCKGAAGQTCPTKYGDWVPPNPPGKGQGPKPTKPLTSSFSFIDMVGKVAEMATALGNTTTANKLLAQKKQLESTFVTGFFHASNNTYDNGVMTTYTLPLHLGEGVTPDKAPVQKNLLDLVATTNKDKNMCGIIGMKFLFEQLAAMGRQDTALAVLEGTDYPSIGFMANNKYEPATQNVWELWDAYTEGVGMNSRNHHMFSSFTKFLVEHPGGFQQVPGSYGYRELMLTPGSTPGLSGASVHSKLANGDVIFNWERAGGLQCSKVPEGHDAVLECGAGGGTIQRVRFASFGRPLGSCGSFGVDTECHSSVVEQVDRLCRGLSSCSIPSTVAALGTPCTSAVDGSPHRLYVEVECGLPAVHANVTIPVGSVAQLVLPAAGISGPALRTSGNYSIELGQDESGRDIYVASLGSGVHSLSLVASEAPVLIAGTAQAEAVELSCPAGHHVSAVRFASFGNPEQRFGLWNRGSCHLGSAIVDAESACLGRQQCVVKVDGRRITRDAHCTEIAPSLAVEVACVSNANAVRL